MYHINLFVCKLDGSRDDPSNLKKNPENCNPITGEAHRTMLYL